MAGADKEFPLWTTTSLARAFGVGVSSIKRWTDEGALKSVKTVGGHRRYHLDDIHDFAHRQGLPTAGLPSLPLDEPETLPEDPEALGLRLRDAARAGRSEEVRSLLARGFLDAVDRPGFLDDVLGEVLTQIGELWARREWGVEEEHRASYAIADAVDRLRPSQPPKGPLATLACPPGELHDLPLRLARVILEWTGWRTDYLGADVPWSAMRDALERQSPAMLLFTARNGERFDSTDFVELTSHCGRLGIAVGVGGSWARGGARKDRDYNRFRTLRGFEKWLRSLPEVAHRCE